MERFIPLSIPNFEGNEKKYVDDALEQGWVSTGGAYITKLENQMSEFLKIDNVAACQSGTAAIHLSLVECGVSPNDMVIVPTLTFIAAVNPVMYQFAEPVFIDCDDSLCIDPIKLQLFCSNECELRDDKLIHKESGKHIKAIIVVHVFGNMADMEQIMKIAETYNIKVIEDATEALGTKYNKGIYAGKYAGTIGDFGTYSFNGNKIITTGGGGAVVSRDSDVVNHLRYLSTQSKDDPLFYIHNEVGYNYRMTNLQAALGVAQMEQLKTFIERKKRNYNLYVELFKEYEYARILPFREGVDSNYWFYSLEIYDIEENKIKSLIAALNNLGIQTRAIWGLIHRQNPYIDKISYEINKASYYEKHVINLPCSTQITDEEIAYVVQEVQRIIPLYVK